jgi:hypothetical protein
MIRHQSIHLDRLDRTIRHRSVSVKFWPRGEEPHTHRRFDLLCHLILGPGLTVDQLFDLMYCQDPEGGPNDGTHVVWVMLSHLRPILRQLDLRLAVTRHSGANRYRVVPA